MSILLSCARLAVSAAGAVALAALDPGPPRRESRSAAYLPSPAARRWVAARSRATAAHPAGTGGAALDRVLDLDLDLDLDRAAVPADRATVTVARSDHPAPARAASAY